ncbi:keratin, type I cytoskeletal 9-like [Anopheles darlingi]|uniref:keratin, type I cytoskeletal 9-like n=1 Tax=Anopheles darlingi TaxID=43151 RepID=UPI002100508F|nr:keratin, type I cytoskeletal 9-like [Anopheles darlingi]
MSAPDNAKAPASAPEQQQQQQQQRHQHQHLLHHPNAAVVPPTTLPASSSTVVAPVAASASAAVVLGGATTVTPAASGTATVATGTVTLPLTTTTIIEASGGGASIATATIHATGSNNSDTSGGNNATNDASSITKTTSPIASSGPLPPIGTLAAASTTIAVVGKQANPTGVATVVSATSSGPENETNPTDIGSGSSSCTPTVSPVVSRDGEKPTAIAVPAVTVASGGGAVGVTLKGSPPGAPTVAGAVGGGSNVVTGGATKNNSGGSGGIGGSGTTSVSTAAGPSSSRSGRSEVAEKQSLEQHCRMLEGELQAVKESETKLKQQYSESQRRERILTRRLLAKDQEVQDYVNQITELKAAQAPGPAALRSALLDPAVNILFQKLKAELQATKAKLEETQNELSAWKFTPDSNTGKRLMAKCRLLYQENEELGKMTSNGRLAKLESELALQKSYNEEVKKSQLELDDFLQELDEDVEGMQGTIVFLQQELKQTKDSRDELEKEVCQLRAYVASLASAAGPNDDLSCAGGGTPTEESAMQEAAALLHGGKSNTTYHHPDGGGGRSGDIIGGSSMGGGVTPIYLVNGAGGSAGSANNANHGSNRLLVNKSSSVVGDQDSVYNRTHCGGVSVYSSELRTTAAGTGVSHSTAGLAAAAAATTSPAASLSSSSSATASITTSAASSEANRSPVNGAITVSDIAVATAGGGPPLLGATNSSGNSNSSCGGDSNIATGDSVHSGSNSAAAASIKQQQQQPQQSQRTSSNTNTGRNGGRTVGARKRNYTDTESELTEHPSDASSSGSAGVRSGDAFEGSGGTVVPMVVDGVVESVANGKVLLGTTDGSGSLLSAAEQQDDTNSNKRMTRSGKGKGLIVPPATPGTAQQQGGSAHAVALVSNSAVSATNVHVASAAKKLRRGSLAIEDETTDAASISEPQTTHLAVHPSQQQPQSVTSANGSN